MKLAFILPAYEVARVVTQVVESALELGEELSRHGSELLRVIVVDDGSRDDTAARASAAGAEVLVHARNRGKGQALVTGLRRARELAADAAVSVDADGQHPARAVQQVALSPAPAHAVVLGIRDMRTSGAPRSSQVSNRIANFFVSSFGGHHFRDSQCGLRRYPLPRSLELGVSSGGYAFETEFLLRALHARLPIAEEAIDAYYPPAEERISHFHVVRDPWRIVKAVVHTLAELHLKAPPTLAAPSSECRDSTRRGEENPGDAR